ncbi:uncharacterized protein LOC141850984 [Brevipalpus obovatus]|uniref:uncharacterized protein LOC141850984 n=1 Tax=Brevipalpus obovatus TaxID=246614 RepID=UPI003D9EC2A4
MSSISFTFVWSICASLFISHIYCDFNLSDSLQLELEVNSKEVNNFSIPASYPLSTSPISPAASVAASSKPNEGVQTSVPLYEHEKYPPKSGNLTVLDTFYSSLVSLSSHSNQNLSTSAQPSLPSPSTSPPPPPPPSQSSSPNIVTKPEFKSIDDILPKCHMKKLDNCLTPALYFTHRPNTTGIASTPKEFALQCKTILKVFQCTDRYMKECATLMFREVYNLLRKHLIQSLARICNNGAMRQNYLKYSPCLHAKVKLNPRYKYTCVNDLQAGLEYLTQFDEVEDWYNIACCSYNRWEKCITSMTYQICGGVNGTNQAAQDLIRAGSGDMMHQVCLKEKFSPDSPFCEKNLPPKGTKARGKYSNSAPSKYFTLFCPNTGF